jgi:transposase InsO family protein
MHLELAKTGIFVSRRIVRQAYIEMKLLKTVARRKVSTTNSRHEHPLYPNRVKGVQAVSPDHIWVADVTYLRVQTRFAYLALLMDLYTRQIVGWGLSFANDTRLTLFALQMAFRTGRRPEIHHSDRGSNYAAAAYTLELTGAGTLISMAATGKPQENGYAERLNRTVKEEEILLSEYLSLEEARQGLQAYVQRYNEDRIHSSLGYECPSQVFADWVKANKGVPPNNS